jgi:hypothetical protein
VTSFTPAAGSPLYRRSCATLTEWGQPVEHILDRLGAAGFGPALRPWSKEADPECEDRLAVFTVRP